MFAAEHCPTCRIAHLSLNWAAICIIKVEWESPNVLNLAALLEVVNQNKTLICELIAEELDLIDRDEIMSVEDRMYALAALYRAAIIDLETKYGLNPGIDQL